MGIKKKLFSMASHEATISGGQVSCPVACQQPTIDVDITDEHRESSPEAFARYLSILYIDVLV
jgi:hypothetical protein